MTAAFTVILPHLRNEGNNDSLVIALDCLTRNTVNEFKLVMAAVYGGNLYQTVNALVEQADTDCCIYMASDTFVAPGWDIPMLQAWDVGVFVTNVLVEPGAIGVFHGNIERDFGRRPEDFRRAEFEDWTQNDAPMLGGEGWYAPYMFSKRDYFEHGGLETVLEGDHHGFTTADIALFERFKAQGGRVVRARSYAYHLQRYSQVDEQVAEKRNA